MLTAELLQIGKIAVWCRVIVLSEALVPKEDRNVARAQLGLPERAALARDVGE